jgi:phosphate transport system substrate-binding protein
MKRSVKTMLRVSMFVLLVLMFSLSCDSCQQNEKKSGKTNIRISGAWALYPMMLVWANEYQKTHNVKIDISGGGAGKGMSDVLGNQVDMGMVSRPIRKEEIDQGAFYIAVTKDAVVATINAENPILKEIYVKGLSREELRKIFMKEITEWGQIIGKELENDKIIVYGRSDASGAAKIWAQFLGDYTQSDCQNKADANFDGDQPVALAVGREKNSIGFNNLNYAYNMENDGFAEGIRPIPIDLNENSLLDVEENFYGDRKKLVHNVSLGKYPSPPARLEYVVSKGSFKGEVKEFVNWILTDGQGLVKKNGYVNLPEEKLNEEIEFLNRGERE